MKKIKTKTKLILPINEKPDMISYTHNAYVNAILSSDVIGGTVAAEYQIDKGNYHVCEKGCETSVEKDVQVTIDDKKESGYSYVFRDCEKNEDYICRVGFRRKCCAWERICIVVDDLSDENDFQPSTCLVKFGCPSGHKLFVKRRDTFLVNNECPKIYADEYFLKVEKRGLELTYFYSLNGKKWNEVYKEVLPARYKFHPLKIGVLVEARSNYRNWMASNYIQLYMKEPVQHQRMIDYYTGPTKHYKNFFTSHFLDVSFAYSTNEKMTSFQTASYIFKRLQEGSYLITELDHYYIPKTDAFCKFRYYHEVMIYGIDWVHRKYYVMGYGGQSSVFTYTLDFGEFHRAINKTEIRWIQCRIDTNHNNYGINTNIIVKHLSDYLNSYNSERDIANVVPGQFVMVYGIGIMEYLIENEEDLFIFCNDTRLSYLMYEHKKMMLDRILYLKENDAMSDDDIEEIEQVLNKNIEIGGIIKNAILMNALSNNKKVTMQKVRGYLEKLVENERTIYPKIISNIESKKS